MHCLSNRLLCTSDQPTDAKTSACSINASSFYCQVSRAQVSMPVCTTQATVAQLNSVPSCDGAEWNHEPSNQQFHQNHWSSSVVACAGHWNHPNTILSSYWCLDECLAGCDCWDAWLLWLEPLRGVPWLPDGSAIIPAQREDWDSLYNANPTSNFHIHECSHGMHEQCQFEVTLTTVHTKMSWLGLMPSMTSMLTPTFTRVAFPVNIKIDVCLK